MKPHEVCMEDIESAMSALFEALEIRKIKQSIKEEDKLYDDLQALLEKHFNYPDFRHH